MPIVSLEELRLAAQRKYKAQYQVIHLKKQKPFIAQFVPLSAGPSLYIAQRQTRMSVTKNPKELDCHKARKVTRLLLHIIHVIRTNKQNR